MEIKKKKSLAQWTFATKFTTVETNRSKHDFRSKRISIRTEKHEQIQYGMAEPIRFEIVIDFSSPTHTADSKLLSRFTKRIDFH